jgi:hypothetical protein
VLGQPFGPDDLQFTAKIAELCHSMRHSPERYIVAKRMQRDCLAQPRGFRGLLEQPAELKGLLIRMNLAGWRELRMLAAERDTTLNALAIEAPNDLLKKRGKQPVVENPLAD